MEESFLRPLNLPLDTATQRFLLLCLRSLWQPAALAEAIDLACREEIEWETLAIYADRAGVAPLLYDRVRNRGLAPASVEQALERAYQQSAMTNATLSVELGRLLTHLAEADVPAIVLKGAALGDALYGNSALRPMTDIDLLLHPEDVMRTLDLLLGLGYAWGEIEPHSGMRLHFENELVLQAPGPAPVPIELHWYLIDSPFYQRHIRQEWFWQTAQKSIIAGREASVLGLEANLLYLSAHYVLHHRAHGLRWLVDIAALAALGSAQIDWPLLLAQAQALCLVTPVQVVLVQLSEDWGIPIAPEWLEEALGLPVTAEERQMATRLMAEHRAVLERFVADLASLPSWHLRLRYGASQLFPSPTYMHDRYRPARPWLLPLTYPYRWALGVKELVASRTARPGAAQNP